MREIWGPDFPDFLDKYYNKLWVLYTSSYCKEVEKALNELIYLLEEELENA